MRFIHTADWQIGKVFKQLGVKEAVLQEARLAAIETIGQLAIRDSVQHVLVAGDVYDSDSPSPNTVREPLERMRRFPTVQWHLLPGNHDPHRPQGVWDRVLATNLPSNIHVHLAPVPFEMEPGAVLFPCPLLRRSEMNDLTSWMDTTPTSTGALRIGLAHGSITGFGSSGDANNPIDPQRPDKAGLDYLALGDWHRTQKISEKVWYSGTPEPDLVNSQEEGKVLVIDIPAANASAIVTEQVTGKYRWHTIEDTLTTDADIPLLEGRLRALPDPSRTLLRLAIRGSLSLAGHADLDTRLMGINAAFFSFIVRSDELTTTPTAADLEAIDFDGVLSQVANRLQARSVNPSINDDDRKIAQGALIELYNMVTRTNQGRVA